MFHQLPSLREEIRSHSFFSGLERALTDAHADLEASGLIGGVQSLSSMIILGLGSPEESRVARYQLALALELQSRIAAATPPRAFDPVFTAADVLLLQKCNIDIMTEDTKGSFPGVQSALFFLPHCEAWLCENLLGSVGSGLATSVMVGNSMSCYQEQWESFGSKKGRPRPNNLLELLLNGQVHEMLVPEKNFPVISAFNELAVHTFRDRPPTS